MVTLPIVVLYGSTKTRYVPVTGSVSASRKADDPRLLVAQ
jgi:hypothetical protein